MEFLLVIPIYFALWGGLFSVGELILLNNRIAAADRNMGYIVPFLLGKDFETQRNIIKVMIALAGKNVSGFGEIDLGYVRDVPGTLTFIINDVCSTTELTSQTDWGNIYSTALSVSGIEFPSFISGMLAAVSFFSGDPVRNEDYVYTAGAAETDAAQNRLGRHFLIVRRSDIGDRNADTEKMLETAFKLSSENILGNPPLENTGDPPEITQDEYFRAFETFFSDAQ